MMRLPDALRVVPIRDPVEWSYYPFPQLAAPPFGPDYVRTPDPVACDYLVDGATFDETRRPEDQFHHRVNVTGASRYRTFSLWGWSIVLIWYGGAR